MASDETRTRADQRFEEALARSGARDPRAFYRGWLRALRERDPAAYRRAREHYDRHLVPRVAEVDADPLAEWLDYGRMLAELLAPGRTVQIDPTGRALEYTRPVPPDHLVLHLPASTREAALPVGLPARLSPAQRATYDLLVERRVE